MFGFPKYSRAPTACSILLFPSGPSGCKKGFPCSVALVFRFAGALPCCVALVFAMSDWMVKKVRLGGWAFGFVALRL